MIVTTLSRPVDPVLLAQNTARGIALLVADAVTAMFDSGRWSQQWPLATEIQQTAALVHVLHAEIGDLCERSVAERIVEVMARTAHEMLIQARIACASGGAIVSPVDDMVLFDVQAEAVLIRTYSLLAL